MNLILIILFSVIRTYNHLVKAFFVSIFADVEGIKKVLVR